MLKTAMPEVRKRMADRAAVSFALLPTVSVVLVVVLVVVENCPRDDTNDGEIQSNATVVYATNPTADSGTSKRGTEAYGPLRTSWHECWLVQRVSTMPPELWENFDIVNNAVSNDPAKAIPAINPRFRRLNPSLSVVLCDSEGDDWHFML